MEFNDLQERATEDLVELHAQLKKELFNYKMRNHTGQLEDTSLIGKTRKDVARIATILSSRETREAEAAAAAAITASAEGVQQ